LGHLDFDIVSNFDIRISDFASLGIFTSVENALQIDPFMQNKPNFPDAQMNLTSLITKSYENKTLGGCGKNKANTKPIKANKMPKQSQNKPNSNPIQTQSNPIPNVTLQKWAITS